MKHLLFSYGSIILPEMTQTQFEYIFTPIKSVFIKGYKLTLEFANSKKYPKYHYILCENTKNDNDLIPGFLVEVPNYLIKKLDLWEGSSYARKKIICLDRELNEIKCFIYLKKDNEESLLAYGVEPEETKIYSKIDNIINKPVETTNEQPNNTKCKAKGGECFCNTPEIATCKG